MLVTRSSENPIRDPSPYQRRYKGGASGDTIVGEVTAQDVGTGDFNGITYVDMTVYRAPPSRRDLVGTTVRVYDHPGCILDLPDLTGFSVWASEQSARTLDVSKACTVFVDFWGADMRCCEANTATYRSC